METRRRLSGSEGFTILETMIALGILAFGLLAVVGLFVAAIGGNTEGGRMTEAVSLAQQKMEEFKTIPYPNIVTSDAAEEGLGPSGAADDPHKFYTRSWTVTEDTARQLKTIVVTVKWKSGAHRVGDFLVKGSDHSISLSTMRAYDR